MLRPRPVLVVLLLGLTLAGCGGSPSGPAATAPGSAAASPSVSASAPASPTSAADPAAAFCSELADNGAGGSDFGAIPTFYPKQQLLDDVQGKLKVMGDATPPTEIASAWDLQKSTLEKVEAAAKKLPSGGRLSDPSLGTGARLEKAEDTITKYWFAHCR